MPPELEPVALEPPPPRGRRRERLRTFSPRLPPRWQRPVLLALATGCAVATFGRLTGSGPAGSLRPDDPAVPVVFEPGRDDGAPGLGPVQPLSRGWRLVRRAPIESRHGAISAWTGRELLVWGGIRDGQPLADGASYLPDTDQWRPMAPSPLPPRDGAASVWTGRELIVWGGVVAGGYSGDGAAYNPETGSWRQLPPAPIVPRGGVPRGGVAAVWSGREMLVWGGGGQPPGFGAAFNPETNRWRPLPAGGPLEQISGSVWTGTEMVVWASSEVAALDPASGRWRRLPDAPFLPFDPVVAWTGQEMLAVGGSTVTGEAPGAAYDPAADRWRALAPSPDPFELSGSEATWTGRLLVLSRGPAAVQVYDPARDEWFGAGGPSDGARVGSVAAWTGEEVIFWAGYGAFGTAAVLEEGFAWRPPTGPAGP